MAVVFEHRTAAGDVDDDGVKLGEIKALALVAANSRAGAAAPL
jgi:hypothetical protein